MEQKEVGNNEDKKLDIDIDDDKDIASKKEMEEIISFINNLNYEQYAKDMEIREALQLIKSKMQKDYETKKEEVKDQNQEEDIKEDKNTNRKEMENINIEIIENNKNNVDNNKIELNNLTEEEKINLERGWNNSTKLLEGEKVINSKGDKEIIKDNTKEKALKEDYLKTKVSLDMLQNLIEKEKQLITTRNKHKYPIISITNDKEKIFKTKEAELPFIYGEMAI